MFLTMNMTGLVIIVLQDKEAKQFLSNMPTSSTKILQKEMLSRSQRNELIYSILHATHYKVRSAVQLGVVYIVEILLRSRAHICTQKKTNLRAKHNAK